MNTAVKNILITLLLVVLSPVTFALCPCLVTTSTAEKNITCCCKKKPVPAERKCPSQKQLIRLQTLEKQRIQDPAPSPLQPLIILPEAAILPDALLSNAGLNSSWAGNCVVAIAQPPTLFLHHCSFII